MYFSERLALSENNKFKKSEQDISKLFELRQEIDKKLLQNHSKTVAVLFTDIVGSTDFFDKKGDIEGLNLVKRHNTLLFPIVENNGGRVVKTIGDAIMAVFNTPSDSVFCAIKMLKELKRENETKEADPIIIRAGIHSGRVMSDGEDVFGDTVNTAARIAHEADGNELFISKALFDLANKEKEINCISKGNFSFKGKSEKIEVISVLWQKSELLKDNTKKDLFILEIQTGKKGLKLSAIDGQADKNTVKPYAEIKLEDSELHKIQSEFKEIILSDNNKSIKDLIIQGKNIYHKILPDRIKKHLTKTDLNFLRIHIDDELTKIPWELIHDSDNFLCLKFATGRIVSARVDYGPGDKAISYDSSAKVLIVSNPSGDLPASIKEGNAVEELFSNNLNIKIQHLKGPLNKNVFINSLKQIKILHFAGHLLHDHDETIGFKLDNEIATVNEIITAMNGLPPEVVFANTCSGAQAESWSKAAGLTGDLASCLLVNGTKYFIAPMWDIPDEDAYSFALEFYKNALKSKPFGSSVLAARSLLKENYINPFSFSGYVLYGDPRGQFDKNIAVKKQKTLMRGETGSFKVSDKINKSNNFPDIKSDMKLDKKIGSNCNSKRKISIIMLIIFASSVFAFIIFKNNKTINTYNNDNINENKKLNEAVVNKTITENNKNKSLNNANNENPTLKTALDNSNSLKENSNKIEIIAIDHTGPIRVAVLSFTNLSKKNELQFLSQGLSETIVTDFGQHNKIRLIERSQVDIDIKEIEFSQSKYVDPKTRSLIGKINGAEVAVLGTYQQAGKKIRAVARFINVETGEILFAVKVDEKDTNLFDLQDKLAVELKNAINILIKKMR